MFDVSILHTNAAIGKPMSIPDEATTMVFHRMDISLEISDDVVLHLVSQ